MAIALIVAAGRGERLGTPGPKAFVALAGKPMIGWSVDAFASVPAVRTIVVAVPEGWSPAPGVESDALVGCIVCEGGAERSLSVREALAAAGDGGPDEPVLVHDAARPLVEPGLIEELIAAVSPDSGVQAAVAATRATDTIKIADDDGNVIATPDRSTLRAVQTPQAFARAVLEKALAQDESVLRSATDDAGLVEGLGIAVSLIDSPSENFKVTESKDLALADLILTARKATIRTAP